jgi:hypothetical protein
MHPIKPLSRAKRSLHVLAPSAIRRHDKSSAACAGEPGRSKQVEASPFTLSALNPIFQPSTASRTPAEPHFRTALPLRPRMGYEVHLRLPHPDRELALGDPYAVHESPRACVLGPCGLVWPAASYDGHAPRAELRRLATDLPQLAHLTRRRSRASSSPLYAVTLQPIKRLHKPAPGRSTNPSERLPHRGSTIKSCVAITRSMKPCALPR